MSKPKRYRKKPVNIEAMIFTGDNGFEIVQWMGDAVTDCGDNHPGRLYVDTFWGLIYAAPGDYIVKDAGGRFHARNSADFARVYEEEA